MKDPLTQAGIEPVTFRFVAQHLNHCATAVPDRELYEAHICPQLQYQVNFSSGLRYFIGFYFEEQLCIILQNNKEFQKCRSCPLQFIRYRRRVRRFGNN